VLAEKMPKLNCSSKIAGFVKQFGEDVFTTDGTVLFCKICEKAVNHEKKYFVTQHCESGKHKALAQKASNKSKPQLIQQSMQVSGKKSKFNLDMCNAFIAADIPLHKLQNPSLRKFLESNMNQTIPCESTLRKTYVDLSYDDAVANIRSQVGNHNIWISVDEATDATGRFVANTFIGTMESGEVSKMFLLNSEELQKTDSSTVCQAVVQALTILWPEGIQHSRVLLLVTDAAAYMKKAASALEVLFPNLIHLTCLAHALHRVAEEARAQYPDVDKLIANCKKVFLKANSRVQLFRSICPDIPLPPQPVLTRWGTWLEAASYYAVNFDQIVTVLEALDEEDAASIRLTKNALKQPGIKNDLAYILTHLSCLTHAITKLETQNAKLADSLEVFEDIRQKFSALPGNKGKVIAKKLERVIEANRGFSKISAISSVLQGEDGDVSLSPDNLSCFLYAPVTSVDVERTFSRLKNILSDRRECFKFEALKKYLVVHCNA
jgi:hypothetical protein